MHKFTRSSYFWNHSCELDTLVNQNSHAAPIRSPVRGRTGFSKSRGLRASVTFFPLPHPAPSTFLLSPHFSRGPNAKTSFARPKFRSHRSGTLATNCNWSVFNFVAEVQNPFLLITSVPYLSYTEPRKINKKQDTELSPGTWTETTRCSGYAILRHLKELFMWIFC